MRSDKLASVLLCFVLASSLASAGCQNLLKKKHGADGGTDAAAPSAPASASASASAPASTPTITPSSLPTASAPPDPLAAKDRKLVDRTRAENTDIDDLVKKGLLADPAKPGEIDAVQRCSTLEDNGERLAKLPDGDGDIAKILADTKRLCSFEVPILDGNAALKQASLPASQASHKLVCDIARNDFNKARAVKPNDRKVFDLGSRMNSVCNTP